jgi:hypothetical protein
MDCCRDNDAPTALSSLSLRIYGTYSDPAASGSNAQSATWDFTKTFTRRFFSDGAVREEFYATFRSRWRPSLPEPGDFCLTSPACCPCQYFGVVNNYTGLSEVVGSASGDGWSADIKLNHITVFALQSGRCSPSRVFSQLWGLPATLAGLSAGSVGLTEEEHGSNVEPIRSREYILTPSGGALYDGEAVLSADGKTLTVSASNWTGLEKGAHNSEARVFRDYPIFLKKTDADSELQETNAEDAAALIVVTRHNAGLRFGYIGAWAKRDDAPVLSISSQSFSAVGILLDTASTFSAGLSFYFSALAVSEDETTVFDVYGGDVFVQLPPCERVSGRKFSVNWNQTLYIPLYRASNPSVEAGTLTVELSAVT